MPVLEFHPRLSHPQAIELWGNWAVVFSTEDLDEEAAFKCAVMASSHALDHLGIREAKDA